ncbi:MAG TPA: hypothetical protein DEB32_08135 [Stenotrophomonas sp.]|nr:hypothetical protein [Stenotrophomonas sp.]
MRRLVQILLLTSFLLTGVGTLVAADLSRKQRTALEEVQNQYGSTIRWGNAEDALGYLDPDYRKAHPLTDLQLRRYEQIRVSSYRERSTAALPDGTVERRVEIGVINVNTQAERTVVVKEVWRWDPQAKRWWQAGGLPDLWQGQ